MTLRDLLEQEIPLVFARGEGHGPCPWCGGTDRFVYFEVSDRYWCRQCGKHGDAIQFLRDYKGLTFREAAEKCGHPIDPFMRPPSRASEARRLEQRFLEWRWSQWKQLLAEREEHELDAKLAEVGWRVARIHRQAVGETDYTSQLAAAYDKLAEVEYKLDILTYDHKELETQRAWFLEEEKRKEQQHGK